MRGPSRVAKNVCAQTCRYLILDEQAPVNWLNRFGGDAAVTDTMDTWQKCG